MNKLVELATTLLQAGWTIGRVRNELFACECQPTASSVEEAIVAAIKSQNERQTGKKA